MITCRPQCNNPRYSVQVLTAYARECERAGIRVAGWREATGCTHVKPFKYSAEHASLEASDTADTRAPYNEVLASTGAGAEVFGGEEGAELELPAYRDPSLASHSQRWRPSHRRHRRPRHRGRSKDKTFVRKNKKNHSLGNFRGFTVEKISTGGSKKRLKWGGRKKGSFSSPPFDMLLSSVEEARLAGDRTTSEHSAEAADYELEDSGGLGLALSARLPGSTRSQPPPLHESGGGPAYEHPSRLNYKRRRNTN